MFIYWETRQTHNGVSPQLEEGRLLYAMAIVRQMRISWISAFQSISISRTRVSALSLSDSP
jgi:hypothetical protein